MCIEAQCLGCRFGLVVGFIELHAVFLGIVGVPVGLDGVNVVLSPVGRIHLEHHLLQSLGQCQIVGIGLHGLRRCERFLQYGTRLVREQVVESRLIPCHGCRIGIDGRQLLPVGLQLRFAHLNHVHLPLRGGIAALPAHYPPHIGSIVHTVVCARRIGGTQRIARACRQTAQLAVGIQSLGLHHRPGTRGDIRAAQVASVAQVAQIVAAIIVHRGLPQLSVARRVGSSYGDVVARDDAHRRAAVCHIDKVVNLSVRKLCFCRHAYEHQQHHGLDFSIVTHSFDRLIVFKYSSALSDML